MKATSEDVINGSNLLHILAQKSCNGNDQAIKKARLLIKEGAKVDATDNKHNTPLHIAAAEGLCELCKVIINEAEKNQTSLVNCLNRKHMTALQLKWGSAKWLSYC